MSDQARPPMVAGMHALPGPVSYQVAGHKLENGDRLVMLRLEHTAGMTMVALDSDSAKRLGRSLIEAASGLHIPKVG